MIDSERQVHVHTIAGCPEASGVLCAQDENVVYAARGAGKILVIDATSLALLGELACGPRPNGLAWDGRRRRLMAADVQDLSARLLDPWTGENVGQVELPGRPRWCIYDQERDRFLVNIREPACIALLTAEPFALTGRWQASAAGPHGLDLDAEAGRAFVACDAGVVLALDLAGGRELAASLIAGTPDAIWAGGLVFAVTDQLWLLILGAFTGTISASSAEVGPFVTVEQAILPQTAPDQRRTWLFSIYDTLGNLAGAAGALFTGVVGLFARLGLTGASAYRPLFVIYAGIGVLNLLLFLSVSDGVEAARVEGARRFVGLHRSTGTVARLSALFGLDALAGGFVIQSIVAYWFHLRWGLSPETLGLLFFWVGVLSGLSLLAAGWMAERFGLLNTMVFTHLPSNLVLVLVPLACRGAKVCAPAREVAAIGHPAR